jgi:predicted DNA-binding transcriptional regulator YafY
MSLFDTLVDQVLQKNDELMSLQPVVEKEILHHDILRDCYGSPRLSEDLDFTGGTDFDPDNLKAFRRVSDDGPAPSYDLIPLKLRLRERSVLNVFRYLYYKNLETEEPDENGDIICRVEVENSIELFLRLLQCGTSVEVLEPLSYRRQIRKQVKQIVEMYDRDVY